MALASLPEMKKPPDPPDWQYDESTGLFVDFHDPEQVVTYDELQNTDVREEERTVEALGISADDTVIEYGAGTGAFVQAAARVCRYVYAVDVSEAMIDYARRRLVERAWQTSSFTRRDSLPIIIWLSRQVSL
jgi:cyclopropane fatty-acyl-phospholipid synthase-like methyltransferase